MFSQWEEGFVVGSLMGLRIEKTGGDQAWFVVAGTIENIFSIALTGVLANVQAVVDNVTLHPAPPVLSVPYVIADIPARVGAMGFPAFPVSGIVAQVQSIIGEVEIHG